MEEGEQQKKAPSLQEEWSLQENENSTAVGSDVLLAEKTEQVSASEENAPTTVENNETHNLEPEQTREAEENQEVEENAPVAKENPEAEQKEEAEEEQEANEGTPIIKLETAPADFRFPTTNQTRHCFTRYIEYHRCIAAKGEGAPECQKFAKYYRSLCPGEWISVGSGFDGVRIKDGIIAAAFKDLRRGNVVLGTAPKSGRISIAMDFYAVVIANRVGIATTMDFITATMRALGLARHETESTLPW